MIAWIFWSLGAAGVGVAFFYSPLLRPWRLQKYRPLVEWGPRPFRPYHITLTPRFGFSLPWPGGRIRWAPHHGLQKVEWRGGSRWVVTKQYAGTSRVRGEVFAKERK